MPRRATTRTALARRTLAPAGSYGQIGECRKSPENALFPAWAQGVAGSNPVGPTPFARLPKFQPRVRRRGRMPASRRLPHRGEVRAVKWTSCGSRSNCPTTYPQPLEEQWDDVPRRSLEAIAVEAYRSGALTESQVRRLLGFERPAVQVHALLKEHHVPLQDTRPHDVEDDLRAQRELGILRPADDRRGRQRAAALPSPAGTAIELLWRFHARQFWCRSLSPVNSPPLERQRSCESGSRSRPPGSMCGR